MFRLDGHHWVIVIVVQFAHDMLATESEMLDRLDSGDEMDTLKSPHWTICLGGKELVVGVLKVILPLRTGVRGEGHIDNRRISNGNGCKGQIDGSV